MVAPTTESSSKLKMKFSLEDFRMSDAWEVVQRRWKTLAVSVLAMWALGLLYAYVVKSTYESTAQVLVMQKQTSLVSSAAPANSSGKSEVSEDLLATHMMIATSRKIVEEALTRTIRKSKLEQLKAEQAKAEERDSNNLRFMIGRFTGAIVVPDEPAASTEGAAAPAGPASEISEPASEPASDVAAAATPEAPSSTTTEPAPVATTPVEPATAIASVPPAEGAAVPAAATVDPVVVADPLAATDPLSTDPLAVDPMAVPGEFHSALDEPPQEPPGPTADGDMVIMLAELPGILEELDTGEMPAQYVIENLEVTRGGDAQARESHVLGLAFRHKDSVESKLVLDALIKSYQSFLNEKFADVNREAAKLIEQASKDLEKELATAQGNYQKFREQSPILFNAEAATNIHRSRYDAYQAELASLTLKLTDARSRLEAVETTLALQEKLQLTDIEKLALIDDLSVTRLSTIVAVALGQTESLPVLLAQGDLHAIGSADFGELLKAQSELKSMMQDFGPNHPEVKKLEDKISAAKAILDKRRSELAITTAEGDAKPLVIDPKMVMNAYLRLLRNDVATNERKEQELLQKAAEEEERAKALVVYELEGERLREEEARAQGLYDAVMDRLREIDLAKDYSGFVNEVIMSPEFGQEVWPSIPIVLLLCTLVGCAIGAGIAGIGEFRDRSFKDPEDIRRDLDLPLLTHVPDLRGKNAKLLVEGSQVHSSIYAYHRPKSRESEVFRGLRTSLFFSTNGQKCQVLMFTSPNQGDGKSTVAANLAVSIAQTGRKVLIVDCDLRRPNVHKLLGVSNDVGLSDVVGGEIEPWDAIQQTETTNLWALPSGSLPSNPAELLQSTTFEQFLKMAREKYDYVILDCPPVLAVADPCIVAPRADGITMVLRVSRDSKPQANRAKDMLARVNGRILGVVVNASQEAAKSGYGKYGESAYAYSYDYGYGKGYGRGYNKYYEEDPSSTRANGGGR